MVGVSSRAARRRADDGMEGSLLHGFGNLSRYAGQLAVKNPKNAAFYRSTMLLSSRHLLRCLRPSGAEIHMIPVWYSPREGDFETGIRWISAPPEAVQRRQPQGAAREVVFASGSARRGGLTQRDARPGQGMGWTGFDAKHSRRRRKLACFVRTTSARRKSSTR